MSCFRLSADSLPRRVVNFALVYFDVVQGMIRSWYDGVGWGGPIQRPLALARLRDATLEMGWGWGGAGVGMGWGRANKIPWHLHTDVMLS